MADSTSSYQKNGVIQPLDSAASDIGKIFMDLKLDLCNDAIASSLAITC